jgi:uncharacterized membrane protein YqhA
MGAKTGKYSLIQLCPFVLSQQHVISSTIELHYILLKATSIFIANFSFYEFFRTNLTMDYNVLRWMCPPQLLTLDERISNVLIILQDLGISPVDLLLVTLGPQNEYKAYKDSFYHGNSLAVDHLLNVVDAEKRGHNKLMRWVNVRALNVVLKRVSKEMDSL